MSLSKERRATILERSLDVGRGAEEITEPELRALVYAANERDRYRALLGSMQPHVKHMEMAMGWRTIWAEEIDAALEGNDGD